MSGAPSWIARWWARGVISALAFALLLLLYAATSSAHLIGTDQIEFALLSVRGGVAHPSGYPLNVLWLYGLSSLMPTDHPILASSLVMALTGWLATTLLWRALLAQGSSRSASLIAALCFGLSTQVWLLHTHAEAFALNHMLCAAIVWLAAPNARPRGLLRATLLGLLAGLALSNHLSAALIAPIGLFGVALAMREAARPHGRARAALALVMSGLALLIGLLPYLSFFLWQDAPHAFVWGSFERAQDLLAHASRQEYGTLSLGPQGDVQGFSGLAFWLEETLLDTLGVGLLLGLFGLSSRGDASPELDGEEPRIARQHRRALALSLLLCGPLFLMAHNIAPSGPDFEVIKRFHGLPMLLLTPFVARGIEHLSARLSLGSPRRRPLALLALTALLALAMWRGIDRTASLYTPLIAHQLSLTLDQAPHQAIVLGSGTHRYLGISYLQEIEGRRPDVTFIEAHMLSRPWYVERKSEELGAALPMPERGEHGKRVLIPEVLAVLRASGRPLYVTDRFAPERFPDAQWRPEGWLWRDVSTQGAGAPPPHGPRDPGVRLPRVDRDAWAWTLYSEGVLLWERAARACEVEGATCEGGERAQVEAWRGALELSPEELERFVTARSPSPSHTR